MLSLGLDIGGSSAKAALVDEHGAVVWEGKSPSYSRPAAAELAAALTAMVGSCSADLAMVQRVGMCAPGLLNERRDAIAKSVNVPGLVGVPLRDLALAALGRKSTANAPVLTITTDAHAAAHDVFSTEHLMGRLLCLSLGTGVGASVLDDGAPLQVSGMSPGHIGQMDVSIGPHRDPQPLKAVSGWLRDLGKEWDGLKEEPIGPDGGRGSLEAYIGLPALIRRYGGEPEEMLGALTVDHLPLVALARAIRICHAMYRPQHIRLLGGVGIRLRHTIPGLRKRVVHQLTSVAREGWTLAAGSTDFHAARGAARLGRYEPFAQAKE